MQTLVKFYHISFTIIVLATLKNYAYDQSSDEITIVKMSPFLGTIEEFHKRDGPRSRASYGSMNGMNGAMMMTDNNAKPNKLDGIFKTKHQQLTLDSNDFNKPISNSESQQQSRETATGESWGYSIQDGPEQWPGVCQHGTRQSPVDFRARDINFVVLNELHFINYDISGAVNMQNNGHGVKIDGFDRWRSQDRPYIYGGGLNGRYTLSQFHFHWSYGHDDGSEHTIGTLHYPVEIHLVHIKDGYSPSEVTTKPDGLAVIGVFMTLSEEGSAWATLDSALRKVVLKDDSTRIFNYTMGVNLPENRQSFYRYSGSLTTPGCNEAVVWTVFAEPIGITDAQLKVLRDIKIGSASRQPDSNSRPTQLLNGRRILYHSGTFNREQICSASDLNSGESPTAPNTNNGPGFFFGIRFCSSSITVSQNTHFLGFILPFLMAFSFIVTKFLIL